MQKLAVALTTQEEFNEYMEYCERMGYEWYNWKNPRTGRNNRDEYKYQTCVIVDWKNIWFGWRGWFERKWYKIISLQEAIGEENKEIIREGEARGFEPKKIRLKQNFDKYKLWVYVLEGDYYVETPTPRQPCIIHKDIVNWMKDHFEPIEEPKRDWIDEAINYLLEKNRMVLSPTGQEYLREAIEKHMPKCNKVTVDEVFKYFSNIVPSSDIDWFDVTDTVKFLKYK